MELIVMLLLLDIISNEQYKEYYDYYLRILLVL